jgi:hypothetical protein
MARDRRHVRWALSVAAIALALPTTADAETWCVDRSGCDAPHTKASVQAAIAAAGANGNDTLDTVLVGAGHYHGPFNVMGGNPVILQGAGVSTVLDDPAPKSADDRTLALGTNNVADTSTVRDLKVVVPPGAQHTGVSGQGRLENVAVVDGGATTSARGTTLIGVLDRVQVSVSGAGGTGVINARRLTRSRVVASGIGVQNAGALIDDLVRVTGSPSFAIDVSSLSNPGVLEGRQLTLVGPGAPADATGVRVTASSAGEGGHDASASLNGIIVRGFAHDLVAQGGPGVCGYPPNTTDCTLKAGIDVAYSDFGFSREQVGTAATVTHGAGDRNDVDPRFRSPAGGDFSLLRQSPLVDAGDPAEPAAGDPATDLAGSERVADGDRNGTARMDIGAFEVPANRAPVAVIRAPRHPRPGRAAVFDGRGSSDADGDPLTFAWQFGDGGTASGARVHHVFRRPGRHRVQLVVTDDRGAVSPTATQLVIVRPDCRVPRLRGVTLARASRALHRAHCRVGHINRRASLTATAGRILFSHPAAGARRSNGARVALAVSRGF